MKWAILWILLVLSVNAAAEKLIFVSSDWPPYMFTKDGRVQGIHVDIIREAAKRLNLDADIQLLPWARAMKYVEDGTDNTVAIFSLKKNPEREKFLVFPLEPIDIEKNVLIARKESGFKANSLADLGDKFFGVVRGYTYDPKFDANKTLNRDEAKDDVQMMQKLDKGRTDLATGEEGCLTYIKKEHKLQTMETVLVLSELPTYVAFSKKVLGPEAVAFAENFLKPCNN